MATAKKDEKKNRFQQKMESGGFVVLKPKKETEDKKLKSETLSYEQFCNKELFMESKREWWFYLSDPGQIIDAERELKYKNYIDFERDNLKFYFDDNSTARKALKILKDNDIDIQDKNF